VLQVDGDTKRVYIGVDATPTDATLFIKNENPADNGLYINSNNALNFPSLGAL